MGGEGEGEGEFCYTISVDNRKVISGVTLERILTLFSQPILKTVIENCAGRIDSKATPIQTRDNLPISSHCATSLVHYWELKP